MTGRSAQRRAVTHRLRARTPRQAQDLARVLAQQVGARTASQRMLPRFLVVGAQRCGTTTLFRLLGDHPCVVPPMFSKGIGYFDLDYDRGWAWYRGHFPLRSTARLQTRRHGEAVTFESSGYYMYHPLAPARIARDLPDARLVVLLRDPVERAWSAFKHESARGFETEPFGRALDLEDERLAGEAERMRAEPGYQSFHHRHHSYVRRGRYAEQIAVLREAVGADRVLVVDANRFFADPFSEFAGVLDWLGLPQWRPAQIEAHNARPSDAMPDAVQQRLRRAFAEPDAALAELLGRPPSWRVAP